MNSLYPIGSIYFGTQDTCPLEIILSNSTWTKVASNIVIDVNTSASVVGNGVSLGFTTNGSDEWSMYQRSTPAGNLNGFSPYHQHIGSPATEAGSSINKRVVGLTSNPANSGLKATITRTNLTVNIWERTA